MKILLFHFTRDFMRKFIVETFEGFVFPILLVFTLLFLPVALSTLIWVRFEATYFDLISMVLGILLSPVGVFLALCRPNYGNGNILSRFYDRNYTHGFRIFLLVLSIFLGYLVVSSAKMVGTKEFLVFAVFGILCNTVMMFLVWGMYKVSKQTLKSTV